MPLRFEELTAVDPCKAGVSNTNGAQGWICLNIAFCVGRSYGMDRDLFERDALNIRLFVFSE